MQADRAQSSYRKGMEDAKRWTVTYTKQLKQKRKVYQDGTLEFQHSSHKVLLYDDCGKLLEIRFLKKDEVIEPGAALTLDNHLVDIGEREGIENLTKDLNLQRRDQEPDKNKGTRRQEGKKEIGLPNKHTLKNQPSGVNSKGRLIGWHVLYTTQLTKKAKTYHDGILHQIVRGSQQRQVMLYDDYAKLLASRYLKKDEVVASGIELAFDTHLVEVGDSEENSKTNVQVDKQSMVQAGTTELNVTLSKAAKLPSRATPKSVKGTLQTDDPSRLVMSSNLSSSITDESTESVIFSGNKLLRDATQILSVIKKPVSNEQMHTVTTKMEQIYDSRCSDLFQSENKLGVENLNSVVKNKCGIQNISDSNISSSDSSRSEFSQSKETQMVPSLSCVNSRDSKHKEESQPDQLSTSVISLPWIAASDRKKPNSVMELTYKEALINQTPMKARSDTSEVITSAENKLIVDDVVQNAQRLKEPLPFSAGSVSDSSTATNHVSPWESSKEIGSIPEPATNISYFPSFDLGI